MNIKALFSTSINSKNMRIHQETKVVMCGSVENEVIMKQKYLLTLINSITLTLKTRGKVKMILLDIMTILLV